MGLTRPTVAQLNTVVTEISDPISVLNQGATKANVDVGFVFNRDNGASANVALYWNETLDSLVIAYTTSTGGVNSNIAVSSYANLTVGNITSSGNISAQYITGSGQFLTGLPASYSNVNVKAYTESMGYTNYSNVNLIAYLGGGVTSTGFINTTANVSASQINSATAAVTGSAYVGELFVTTRAGDEGGQIQLATAVTNTTLSGNVTIDVYQNRLRIWESGGTNRGGYFDIAGLTANVGTNLAAGGGGGTPGGGNGQLQFNSSSTFAGAASLYYFAANGAIVANAGIASTSTTTGTMQITGGIGISGAVVSGQLNTTGNVLAAGASIFGNVALGSLATPGALNTLAGNVSILGVSSMLNIIGNIVVNNTAIASSNVTGAIRTTGGVGVGGNLYVGQRVGYVWGANNVSSVYQIFNNSTNSLDTVFG